MTETVNRCIRTLNLATVRMNEFCHDCQFLSRMGQISQYCSAVRGKGFSPFPINPGPDSY